MGVSANHSQDSQTLQLSLPGMKCGACVGRIAKALHELDGIQAVDINLQAKSALLQFSHADTDTESIVNAIAEAGYHALPMTQPNDLKQSN